MKSSIAKGEGMRMKWNWLVLRRGTGQKGQREEERTEKKDKSKLTGY